MKNLDKMSKKFENVSEQWETIDALLGGTKTMREAGTKYLPQEPKEGDKAYKMRLDRTTLFNATGRTIMSSVGKVFSREIIVDTASDLILEITEDVDQKGKDISTFGIQLFSDAVAKGVSYILVDHTKVKGTGPGGVVTRADEFNQGARPYWVHIKANQTRSAVTQVIDGIETLTYFRYVESRTSFNPTTHEEKQEQIVRVLMLMEDRRVAYKGYKKVKGQNGDEWVEIPEESGILSTNIRSIPIAAVVTNEVAPYLGSPPLMDQAEKNIELWQSYSDQKNILHYARVPFLLVTRDDSNQDPDEDREELFELGGNTVLETGPNGDAKWVEHGGKSIASGRQDLEDIKAEMVVLGLELHTTKPGTETATGKAINTAEANSWLKMMALSLRNALETALVFSAQYAGVEPELVGEVIVNTEYSIPFKDSDDIKVLLEMYQDGVIDATTLLNEAKRRNMLNYTTDIDEIVESLPPKEDTNKEQ